MNLICHKLASNNFYKQAIKVLQTLVLCPDHTLHKENSLVNQVEVLGLEAPLRSV